MEASRRLQSLLQGRGRASPRASPAIAQLGLEPILGGVQEADLLQRHDCALPLGQAADGEG
eukprot:15478701-Alexandrium_andersonii.AAC.1